MSIFYKPPFAGIPFICSNRENTFQDCTRGLFVNLLGNSAEDFKGLSLSGFYNKYSGDFEGLNLSSIKNVIEGYSKGVNISLFNKIKNSYSSSKSLGLNISGIANIIRPAEYSRDDKGFFGANISLLNKMDSSKGINIGVININNGKDSDFAGFEFGALNFGGYGGIGNGMTSFKGVSVGLVNYFSGHDCTGAQISGLFNYSGGCSEGFFFQCSPLGNSFNYVDENSFYLQIGLWNKAGENYSPIINCGGLKNLPRIIKNSFKKKSKLESKLNQ